MEIFSEEILESRIVLVKYLAQDLMNIKTQFSNMEANKILAMDLV
jgi:hypothetical protein